MMVKPSIPEVTVLPMERAILWPQMCCCCGSDTDLDLLLIYSRNKPLGSRPAVDIPYCRRCKSHHRGASQRASSSAVTVFLVGLALASLLVVVVPGGGLGRGLLGVFLMWLFIAGAALWGARTYFVARAEIKSGITPACSGGGAPAVSFTTHSGDVWRFRFCNLTYAEQFAERNSAGAMTMVSPGMSV